MGKKPKSPVPVRSTVNIGHLTGKRRGAIVKEEILHRGAEVVKAGWLISIRVFADPTMAGYSGTTTAMGTTIAISWGRFLPWIFLDTKRYWTGFNGRSPNSGEMKMSKEAKVRVVTDGVDGFFSRAREHARKLDRGEKLEAELVIAFEDASEMMKVLSAERLRVLRASKKATPVSVLAGTLKRNPRAVSRDINLLESFGLLRTRYVPNPGHGRRRIVESRAKTYQLIATI